MIEDSEPITSEDDKLSKDYVPNNNSKLHKQTNGSTETQETYSNMNKRIKC